ncbi:YbjQ family protein [Alteromonas lipotrueae]|uniref:YbjQ family protein n=1 Tax=Alteromonas lipotrueae TaxID=2803814 RepID=UPI001C44CC83|nr:YbjQ family protein [Alteromonas lipotrueae]
MSQISISVYCEKHNITEDEVKAQIRNGELVGGPKMGVWYVDVDDIVGVDSSAILKEPQQQQLSSNSTPKQLIVLSSLDYISKKEILELGLVSASSVQSVNILKSVGAEIRSQTIGGKSETLSSLMDSAREHSLKKLQSEAYKLKADAIIGIRFSTSEVLQRGVEVMAYGTAVKVVG